MILDCHIHIFDGPPNRAGLETQLAEAEVDGAVLISMPPPCFTKWGGDSTTEQRLDNLRDWTGDNANLFGFYWIDPTEDGALEQVALAVQRGVAGFKVICGHFFPRDERAMPVYRAIAEAGKPLLFHSGILFDGQDSSRYNRPAEFEAMLQIPRLKFALAHISWPWCDELIAVYGKFQSARRQRPDEVAELFIDTTPGTPGIYREEALRKLFTVNYDVKANVMMGTDRTADNYKHEQVKRLIASDTEILQGLGLGDDVIDAMLGGNLQRFLGV